MIDLPDIPAIATHMGVNCGLAGIEENGIWLTIRDNGQNKTVLLKPDKAIELAERLKQAADERE